MTAANFRKPLLYRNRLGVVEEPPKPVWGNFRMRTRELVLHACVHVAVIHVSSQLLLHHIIQLIKSVHFLGFIARTVQEKSHL